MAINFYVLLFFAFSILGCKEKSAKISEPLNHSEPEVGDRKVPLKDIIANLKDSHNKDIIVVSHRGDWRNAPENSLQAIQNCIDMGVDMVEIDVRETKDGKLILMHDNTIDRTTKGKGAVKDWTLDSLKTLRLVDGLGVETPHQIPTLEEALNVCRGKILVNLDKSYEIFDKCYRIAQKTATLDQVIIKGTKAKTDVEREFGQYLDKVFFMPIVHLDNENAEQIVQQYLEADNVPVAFEFTVPQDTIRFIQQFNEIREKGSSVWVNSLWPQHNGGHDDEKAVADNTVYDWFVKNNIDIIQTDRPKILLEYLRSKNLHR